ncbi:prepilin-type N-terminal cleavage/methylation domain-containing protein [Halobacillus locisalis]|uniref:Prepilin-type N-terminal cleavage/methylation domain-containing protein n=1 Tax=Halobacillus locisalis TaxID=220753 RepID=A0A838CNY3_9BACI|nr:prepilin-type N-terminal cleavage/methylation domain-containing protein [Halobacillus locisalis]MBA2173435.1 prepilin-type N-terminal cleavage/methylation domain-containing protein [Halobacillus locisalis]
MNNLLNNKGITLVELLAALALVGIIVTVAGSLVTQTYQSNSKVQNEIDLKQQTNSILTIIREQITEENMEICLVDRHTIRLDDDGQAPYLYSNLITKEQLTISELYIENLDKSSTTNAPLNIKQDTSLNGKKCITTNNYPTSIKITTMIESDTNKENKKYTTSTIITKRSEEIDIALSDGENPGEDENDDSNDGDVATNDCSKLNVKGSNTITQNSLTCLQPVSISKGSTHTIDGAVTFNERLEMKNSAKIVVLGSVTIYGELNMKKDSKLIVKGALSFASGSSFTQPAKGTICVEGAVSNPLQNENIEANQGTGNCSY